MGFGLSLILTGLLSGAVTPSGVELEYVVDNGAYQPPGLPGLFFIERTFPLICDDSVIFSGITEFSVNSALYAATPTGVEVVANSTIPVPGSEGTFQKAEEPACDGDRVFFAGDADLTPGTIGRSIYSWRRGGGIEVELAAGINIGSITAYSFLNPNPDQGSFVAQATLRQIGSPSGNGLVLKRRAQPPQLIAENFKMVLPGHSGPADGYGRPILRDSDIYFLASQGSNTGLYLWSPQNGFSLLVDNQIFYKEIEGNFLGFGEYIVVPEGFIFEAGFSGGIGLFLLRGEGQLSPIVVPGDQTIQGETIRQAGFIRGNTSFFTFHGSLVGSPPFVESAFLRTPDGRIQRILTDGESIDGQPVFASLSSARGYEAAVLVDHGGSLATTIYRLSLDLPGAVAEVPTLSGAVLTALAAALAVTGLGLLRRT